MQCEGQTGGLQHSHSKCSRHWSLPGRACVAAKGQTRGSCYLPPCFYFLLQAETKRLSDVSVNMTFAASVTFGVSLHENIAAPSSTDFLGRVRAAPRQSGFSVGWPVCLQTSLLGRWTGICLKQPNKGGRRGSKRRRSPEAKLFWGCGWEGEVVLVCFVFWENIPTAKTNKDACSRSCYLWSPWASCQFPDYFYELFNPGLLFPL